LSPKLRANRNGRGPQPFPKGKCETTIKEMGNLADHRKMKWLVGTLLLTLLTSTAMAYPQPVQWQTYSIAATGTSVDIPTSIFTEKAEGPGGYGERLKTDDGKAELTVQAGPNRDNDTPARFLAKRRPPAHTQYKRPPDFSLFPATNVTRSIILAVISHVVSSTA
jgi:hypothetical protein